MGGITASGIGSSPKPGIHCIVAQLMKDERNLVHYLGYKPVNSMVIVARFNGHLGALHKSSGKTIMAWISIILPLGFIHLERNVIVY